MQIPGIEHLLDPADDEFYLSAFNLEEGESTQLQH